MNFFTVYFYSQITQNSTTIFGIKSGVRVQVFGIKEKLKVLSFSVHENDRTLFSGKQSSSPTIIIIA